MKEKYLWLIKQNSKTNELQLAYLEKNDFVIIIHFCSLPTVVSIDHDDENNSFIKTDGEITRLYKTTSSDSFALNKDEFQDYTILYDNHRFGTFSVENGSLKHRNDFWNVPSTPLSDQCKPILFNQSPRPCRIYKCFTK
jgi:hypothetical protein